MSGHSKWHNIQGRKNAQDAKRGKIFQKISRELFMAAKQGGSDPNNNPALRLVMDKARAANMPKDNVNRAIQRGAGGADEGNYEEVRYEGYGVGGAAVIVDCLTDNRNRTAPEVRHAFNKHGGNLGVDGSVVFQFKHCGQFIFAPGTNEEAVMEAALEAGAEDVITDEEGLIEVICAPSDFSAVKDAFAAAGLTPEVAEVTMKAENETELEGEDAIMMRKLLDALESLDDVQEVYTTAVMDETE